MVYRLSWVAGAGGVLLALMRLNRLLRPSAEGIPWQVVLLSAAVLGAAVTWAGIAYRLDGRLVAAINLAAAGITAVRIAVPATTWLVFPTLSSFGEMRYEIEFAREVIRAGVPPVIPLAGVVAILAVLFWGLGALLSWGLLAGRPYLAVLGPLVAYLQFATMDRSPASWWLWLFLLFLGAALLAVAVDRRREGTGLLTSPVTHLAVPRSLPGAAVVTMAVGMLAVAGAQAAAGIVPGTGVLEWRVSSGLTGEYYGGVAYNPFVGIQQRLVSQTDAPVFVAALDGDVPADRLYWRLVTLESFNGTQWYTAADDLRPAAEAESYEDPAEAFRGPSEVMTQEVTILALEMGWLPAAYAPVDVSTDNRTVASGFRIKGDGSIRFDATSYRGMAYTVTSRVPEPDLAVLSSTAAGSLSAVFQGAADDGSFEGSPVPLPPEVEPPDAETYLDLPSGIDPRVAGLAREQVDRLTTDFERALALEAFFRAPGRFAYSTAIDPGHGAEDLADWLLDPDSPNYRTGYCEQFATAMAVMARQLGIPSRVVLGFTPGSLYEDGRVVVRDRNAHAWVELWMPTQGWVRFDPTPRADGVNPSTSGSLPFDVASYLDIPAPEAPPATIPGGSPVIPSGGLDPGEIIVVGGGEDDAPGIGFSVPAWVLWAAAGAAGLFGLVPGVKWLRRRRRMRRLAGGDVSAAWREVVDRLDDLGIPAPRSATPREVAGSVSRVMEPLAETYAASVYGDPLRREPGSVAVAEASLAETLRALAVRFSRWRRLGAQYRLRSLVPARFRWPPERP